MENPERIWLSPECPFPYQRCQTKLSESLDQCPACAFPYIEYIRADLAAPLPRPSDEPLRDAIDRQPR